MNCLLKMSFAENKVKEYISDNLKKFQDGVRVAQMLHLRCFTTADREEIRAFERLHGNSLAFWEFFQRLHVRKGWVQQFMEALRNDHSGDLAEELQEVYRRHQLPPPRRNTSTPAASCAMGEAAQLHGTGTSSCSLPPPAEMAPSPQQSLPISRGARPLSPFPMDAPRPASPATIPAVSGTGDCNAPVQETELPSQSSEMTVRPKVMHNAGKAEPSTPPKKAAAPPSKVGDQKPTDGQATSATSASPGPPERLGEVSFPSTPAVSLRPGVGSLTHRWDSGQQQATHKRHGFSGNWNCVKDNGASPSLTGAPNQPEENYYSSADSSPLASGCPEEQQGEGWLKQRKVQALPGNQNEELLGNPVGADASPSHLQQRFVPGQEKALGSRGSCGNVAVEDVGEMPNVDPATEGPGNPQPRGNTDHVPGDVAARLSSGAPWLGTSPSDQPQLLTNPVGNAGTSQMPAAALVFHPLPSDWEIYTSTDVIPPNSPPGSSDFVSVVTKLPIQEKKLPFGEPSGTHASLLTREKVPSAAVDWSTVNFRRNGNDRIFHSNCDDDSLCKPEILMSHPDDPPMGLPGQQPSGQEGTAEYSGRTDRFRCSGAFSLGSDSLQRSDSSRSSASGKRCPNPEGDPVPGRNVRTTAALDASHQPSIGSQQENGSIRTFVHSVKQEASVDVTGAPETMDLVGASTHPSPDVLPDSATGRQPVTGVDAHRGSSQPNEAASNRPSSTPSNDILLLAGAVALASVAFVVFVLLKRK